ncbi:hypothetical protein [Enterococcus pallens]|uniref:Lipoprotein n=1 Tax=Enterococcus pallens ATCC BAA-351 TaxID=1158607 RepID=R2SEF9_9ENTE|nr:hypothetical protein [Enterococcus pallens]EOH93910.1 hypothetical protein UAU_02606 [Enterococcus pallens ATCC BAA-351]EOU24750.1 hypothetical protein I588_00737 [Enterococcus pallens ATCC BAA-351]OJG77647.1 hypothetical protein RV10_GL002323 [Enterococcus pallens]
MKKLGKVGLIIALIFVLAGCQQKQDKETKKAEPKVTQTKKKAKKTTTTSTSEKQQTGESTLAQQAPVKVEPAANPEAGGNQANNSNQTGNNANPANTPQGQTSEPAQPAQPEEIKNPGVYSREECIHIARMTISMSGVDETQFTEDQLYNYYDQCAQLGADYSYLLGLVAQDIGGDKQAMIEQYHLVHGLNPDGSTPE